MENNRAEPRLFLVVPCYNEEEALPVTEEKLSALLTDLIARKVIAATSKIVYVDDGSRDKTWELIEKYHGESSLVSGVKLSRNKGHQYALTAGLEYATSRCDVAISIDADLQDDITVIEKMIAEYVNGSEIVYGVRDDRSSDSGFKRNTAQTFYKIMTKLGAEIVYNHADFRLMSKVALEALARYREVNLFLRGIIPELGYKSSVVKYARKERLQGESKYPLRKMLALALEGILSAGAKPMFIIIGVGCFFAFIGLALLIFTLIFWIVRYFPYYWMENGLLCLIGGLIIAAVGYVGLNVSRNYMETKRRPRFIVEKELD